MSMQTEVDVKKLQAEMRDLQQHVAKISEVLTALIEQQGSAVVEGDDITVKASPNGQIKGRKTHR